MVSGAELLSTPAMSGVELACGLVSLLAGATEGVSMMLVGADGTAGMEAVLGGVII